MKRHETKFFIFLYNLIMVFSCINDLHASKKHLGSVNNPLNNPALVERAAAYVLTLDRLLGCGSFDRMIRFVSGVGFVVVSPESVILCLTQEEQRKINRMKLEVENLLRSGAIK